MYIIGSDFDGTINYHGVSDQNREAIRRFRAAGNQFGIVTGRDQWMYKTLIEENVEFDFVLAFNGGLAVKPDGSYWYAESATNKDNCIGGIAYLLGEKYHTWLSTVLDNVRHTFSTDPSYHHHHTILPDTACELKGFNQMNTVCRSDEDAKAAAAEINARWGDHVTAMQNGWAVDVVPKGVDKGQGTARYAAMIGVPADNIYCVGDNVNDIPMISRFHGCAVANARDEVKAAAEFTFDGVWTLIDHILSLKEPEKLKK